MPRNLLALFFLIALGCKHSDLGHDLEGLSNFGEVTPDVLYRGAQPDEAGIKALKEKGIRTVVNLRDDFNPAEKRWVEAAGLNYVQIPSNAFHPVDADVRKFLAMMAKLKKTTPPPETDTGRVVVAAAPKPEPVFVHCAVGRDRTGLFVAAYQIALNHYETDAALKEMNDYGHESTWFPRLQPFIREQAEKWRAANEPVKAGVMEGSRSDGK
jgi:protein tyrosine/serine phosphatase